MFKFPHLTPYRDLLRLLGQYRLQLAGLLVTSLLVALTEGLSVGAGVALLQNPATLSLGNLTVPPAVQSLYQWILAADLLTRVRIGALALVSVILVRSLFLYANQMLVTWYQVVIDRELRRRVFQQILAVQTGYIQQDRTGNLLTLLNDYTRQAAYLARALSSSLVSLFTVLIYAVLMLGISWQLTLLAIALQIVVVALLRSRYSLRIRQSAHTANQESAHLNAQGVESISAIHLIHLFSREGRATLKFENTLDRYIQATYTTNRLVNLSRPLFNAANAVALGLLLVASTFFLPGQTQSWLSLMIIFLGIVLRLSGPIAALNDLRANINSYSPALQRVLEFLRSTDKPYLLNGSHPAHPIQRGITLEGVSFRYAKEEAPALDRVSFTIPHGKLTAVVGVSGAGKSTLIHLLARLYDPQSGQICVDGVDLRALDLGSWHSQVAVVSQDTFLFNDTVEENLRFAREDATLDEIRQAAENACASNFIEALPQGYQTVLGERGVRLSGGEQQRIAIARALLAAPQFLILDEATSHLDTENERAIQAAIERLGNHCTLLVVAHRLSTVLRADQIVVLEGGRLVEQGTHNELIHRGGVYTRLVQAQKLTAEPIVAG